MIIPSVFGSEEGVLWCDSIMLCHYVHVAQFVMQYYQQLSLMAVFSKSCFSRLEKIYLELNVLLRNGLVCHNVHSKLYTAVRKHLKNSEHLNFKNGCIC